MILTINHRDYTAALDAAQPLTIGRTLNTLSVCEFALTLPQNGSLGAPARFQPISVKGDNGIVYFTGYLAATPLPEYAGLGIGGPRYRYSIRAASDEILLDQCALPAAKSITGLTAGGLMANITAHTGSVALDTSILTLNTPVAHFTPEPGAKFSKSAGQLAPQARAAYRAQSGKLSLAAIPTAIHNVIETDGSFTPGNLAFRRAMPRNLANDITVCGEREPAAYVTEVFQGDGATDSFVLSADPYFPPASSGTIISELFDEPAIDTRVWGNPSGNAYFALSGSGLTMHGGSGIDGQTQLAWLDPVEIGGTLLLEAQGVTLANGSAGVLAAFFSDAQTFDSCVAGFQATSQPGSGAVSLRPIVNGTPCGTSYGIDSANQYTLRLRIHSPEQQRTTATYLACGDNGPIVTGGRFVPSPARLLFEIQETVDGVTGMPVTLYDGGLAAVPASCLVVAASSLTLNGSMRALHLTNLGSAWVVSTPKDGAEFTRRLGSNAQSAECHVERTGRLAFHTGYIPAVGEQITVTYRTTVRAVGRSINAASQQTLAAQGVPSTASWIGSVLSPPARSSVDCRNAAAALLEAAASTAALWSGTYRGTNFDFATDVWPGDALAVNAPSCGLAAQLVVRNVKLSYRSGIPDLFEYEIDFANDWAEDLAIRTADSVPDDAWLPAPITPHYAANLNSLMIGDISGNKATINTGITPPDGGGFEIRTRDYAFMPGEDPSLVMRGAQPNLTFTRTSSADRFYIRMFDAADPPNYSEFSAVVILNRPLNQ